MTVLNLVRCYDWASEDEWTRFLLKPLRTVDHHSPDFSCVEDNAIYFIVDRHGLGHVPQSFIDRVGRSKRKGLYHLGDEWLSGGHRIYRHFDFVIRNYYSARLCGGGIRTVPLGYPNGLAGDGTEERASKRPLVWSFAGNMSAARPGMIAALKGLEPHYLHTFSLLDPNRHVLNREEYRAAMRSSTFVPCPMGNVMLETWRVYEALEAGAIPLLSRRALMPYHDLLMPGHPIPAFTNWRAACRFARELLADPAALDRLQERLTRWWRVYKEQLQAETVAFVQRGLAGEFREMLHGWQPRIPIGFHAWRLLELSRHHDVPAAMRRGSFILGRLGKLVGSRGSA